MLQFELGFCEIPSLSKYIKKHFTVTDVVDKCTNELLHKVLTPQIVVSTTP